MTLVCHKNLAKPAPINWNNIIIIVNTQYIKYFIEKTAFSFGNVLFV